MSIGNRTAAQSLQVALNRITTLEAEIEALRNDLKESLRIVDEWLALPCGKDQ